MNKRLPLVSGLHIQVLLSPNMIPGYQLFHVAEIKDYSNNSHFWQVFIKYELFDLISNHEYKLIRKNPSEIPVMVEFPNMSDDDFLLLKLSWPQ